MNIAPPHLLLPLAAGFSVTYNAFSHKIKCLSNIKGIVYNIRFYRDWEGVFSYLQPLATMRVLGSMQFPVKLASNDIWLNFKTMNNSDSIMPQKLVQGNERKLVNLLI